MNLFNIVQILQRYRSFKKLRKHKTSIPEIKLRTVLPVYDIVKITDKTGKTKQIIAVSSKDREVDYNSWVKDLEKRGINYLRASIKNGI